MTTALQLPMFAPTVSWTATPISELPSWRDARRVCVDVEACDPLLTKLGPGIRRGGYMCGIAFAIEDGPEHYVPFRHLMGGNVDEDQALAYFRDQAREFTGTICGNNLPYDLDHLWERGVVFSRAAAHRDTQVADPLLDENQFQYNLDAIAARHGLPGKDEDELRAFATAYGVDPKSEMWKLHAGAVARYAMRDVRLPLEILRRQERQLEADDLWRAYDLECRVMLALVRMRRRGVAIDFDRLDGIDAWAAQVIAGEQERIAMTTGIRVSPSFAAGRELAAALAAEGHNLPTTPTGQPSTAKEVLAALPETPVVVAIRRGKAFAKLRGTYVAGVRAHAVRGRLYPTFHNLRHSRDDNDDGGDEESSGARYGRCSASNPNLQAQPIRNKEYGKKWRGIYRPDQGKRWWKGDFSQQEPRTTLSYAERLGLPGAREIGDLFRADPARDSYEPLIEISQLDRDTVKIMFLARSYGAGGARMADMMRLPTTMLQKRNGEWYRGAGADAQKKIDQFDATVPYLKILAKRCEETMRRRGYIILLDGRRCRGVRDQFGNYEDAYAALNRLSQGTAAVQTKHALLAIEDAGAEPQLTVHDEFDGSEEDPAVVRRYGEAMRDALPMSVPSCVDMGMGDSYGELEDL